MNEPLHPSFVTHTTQEERNAFCNSILRMVDALIAANINKDAALEYYKNLLETLNDTHK